eukprot:759314-Hanusia_phi.AAC.2
MPKSKVTINTKLRRVIHAYTKTVVKKKAAGIMDVQEGRTNITLPEYREVTRIMREMRPRVLQNLATLGCSVGRVLHCSGA